LLTSFLSLVTFISIAVVFLPSLKQSNMMLCQVWLDGWRWYWTGGHSCVLSQQGYLYHWFM